MTTTTTDSVTWTRGAGPLTTVFTTPDFCQSLYWTDTLTPPLSSLICMPPRFKQLYDYSWGYFSPGICPTGYSEGCAFPTSLATEASNTGWVSYGGPVAASESLRICCPNGYICVTDSDPQRYSKCSATTDTAELAFAIQVRWAESDLSILATDPTEPGKTFEASATTGSGATSATATATATATTTATTSAGARVPTASSSTDSDKGAGDSARTMAIGIGVGVGAFVLIVAAIAFFLLSRRRRQRAANGSRLNSTMDTTDLNDQAPAAGDGAGAGGSVIELDSKTRGSELDSSPVAAEMPAAPMFYAELPGDMPQVYHEKPADGDGDEGSHQTGAQVSPQEPGPVGQLMRRSTGRGTANLEVSPLVTSPSSWRSSVSDSVSDWTDRNPNGNTT